MNRKHALFVKRCCDVVFSLAALVMLSPLMACIALYVKIKSGGLSVIFSQIRPGCHGRPFRLYKFRSMTEDCGPDGLLLPDALRLKPWGLALRRCSLDELPQLWNVLKGDMSFIGPRPLLMRYLPLYTPEQARRHNMPPGLTGLTAVMGRNSLDWDRRFYYDLWYIDHWSLILDIRIAFRTVFTAFFSREGIRGCEISDEFKGG